MSESETQSFKKQQKRGLPAYMATFADLMSLLMCFFVLLLSFAEIDAIKYKMVVLSLEKAFGVQRDVVAEAIPKGTSIIAQEFSPGEPKPTPLNIVRQETTDETRDVLKVTMDAEAVAEAQAKQVAEEVEEFKQALVSEIERGLIVVENQLNRIVIRIRERGSFPSGDATLNQDFVPILKKINEVLTQTDGLIAVAGHTDNIPISTSRYRSNWELSTSRATSVVHELLRYNTIPPERFVLEGYADTRPLAPNDSAENRATNRRVEIVVLKGSIDADFTQSIDDLIQQHDVIESEIQPVR
ncbi:MULTISPECIES: flagellar motor protein MotB [unclassified Methylophaga]|jgi:chemotaxis protein MotB|uniref:flagellar motor protein MotB n=1 Tax=unclassified Methylophaga TaxID=2629249 RepID=UPI000C8E7DFB|nr:MULTISPECIES: flagellar motor protein MotB [unclassified Methylophaga]MAK67548.1 type VI secretion system protein TssL [Methylophaga sp.]MAY18781.1 type VI secretion system protein TssL [Methylophaga sp.]HAO24524.1 type VI secretion system protein TssL [Methylophaga sp.]HCD06519.1 type VI secretion system protein TssL [Methylophaga sp.]|tara:strand:- start:24058 stop:24954 length:897 start_codon:yes stop_codon:yes gene_type:complete